MKYQVKNVKSFQGREGHGFECSLYKDGKKIGTVTDTADGGMIDFYLDKGEEEILEAFCKTLPKWSSELTGKKHDTDKDMFITNLVDEWEDNKKLKRLCKTKTVVLMSDNKEGEYSVFNIKFSENAKQQILKKYENPVFMNERLLC